MDLAARRADICPAHLPAFAMTTQQNGRSNAVPMDASGEGFGTANAEMNKILAKPGATSPFPAAASLTYTSLHF